MGRAYNLLNIFLYQNMKSANDVSVSKKRLQVGDIVDHLFRYEFSKCIAYLKGAFPNVLFGYIEDAVQEALYKAVEVWPYSHVPDNPTKWVLKVARNKLLDQLRKDSKLNFSQQDQVMIRQNELSLDMISDEELDAVIRDDLLQMMFSCCDPNLSFESQIILTLKILCGFSNQEVARALLKKEESVAKAYTRGKQRLKINQFKPQIPDKETVKKRLPVILRVLYLLFNEGYKASAGEDLIRRDLCNEAIRLLSVVENCEPCRTPETYALQALMCLNIARIDSRTGLNGELMTLSDQDRGKYDFELIQRGFELIEMSKSGRTKPTEYFVLACISAWHSVARHFEDTNWIEILSLYDVLTKIKPSPVTELNRLVAVCKVKGAGEALKLLSQLQGKAFLKGYYLYHATEGYFFEELGHHDEATTSYNRALSLVQNKSEQNYLQSRIDSISHS